MRSGRVAFPALAKVVVCCALGVSADVTAAPAPLPNFALDEFLLGDWACTVVRDGEPDARLIASFRWELGGRWLGTRSTLLPAVDGDAPTSTIAYETFDAKIRRWVYVAVDDGGEHPTWYSIGWKGSSKIYGSTPADPRTWRVVRRKLGTDRFRQSTQVRDGKAWRTTARIDCSRQT